MRWICLFISVSLFCFSVFAMFNGNELVAEFKNTYSEDSLIFVPLFSSIILFGIFYISKTSPKDDDKFIEWIIKNQDIISSNYGTYKGVKITPRTKLYCFIAAVSIGIASYRVPSRYYIKGIDNIFLARSIHILISLLIGWFGIPWGPIFTIQALTNNLSTKSEICVRDIIRKNKKQSIADPI